MHVPKRPEPVAIVGMGLRGPGTIHDASSYWAAIIEGRDLISDLPDDRRKEFPDDWEGLVTRGGYLKSPFDFDARFFGMSPREARTIDPQHRQLLEVVWESFEDAAIRPDAVVESTGVFVGITGQDYWDWLPREPNAYATTGNGHSFSAGRVAHQLGFQGPALALDTACSSALVAVHTACRALTDGDCDVAVAAGVNLVLSPRTTRAVARTGALSPDGIARPFDAAANGFVRGEACAAIVLKRLPDAVAARDRIHAVVNGSAINQDGRSSSFTAPNGESQAKLIRSLLAAVGISGNDIGYHEAHGTGTPVGDPIEMRAIVTGMQRGADSPTLCVGSVKSNVGHSEAAAGLLGMIKVVLCLQRRVIPPQARFDNLNPRISLADTGIVIPSQPRPWDPAAGSYASVCSYGMSGTNACAILSAPAPVTESEAASAIPGFMISARTRERMRTLAESYRTMLAVVSDADYPAFAYTVTHGRTRHQCAAWVKAGSVAAARSAATAVAADAGHQAVRFLDQSEPLPWPQSAAQRRVLSAPTYAWEHVTHVVSPGEE